MAYESPSFFGTFAASTGLKQYQAVELNSAGVLINPTTNGRCIGILCSSGTTSSTGRAGSTTSGSVQTVQFYGIGKILSGSSAIVIGDVISAATDGRAAAASTNNPLGRALAAGVSTSTVSEVISVLLLNSAAQAL